MTIRRSSSRCATKPTPVPRRRRSSGRAASRLPLFGVPVAVKDNIDVKGLPTTAACPAFAYQPAADATAVARLRAAGAIVIGKTNLDQFATGLVGVRSPYGVPRNPFDAKLIPGGSSSGSAVAVAAGPRAARARHRHRRLGPRAGRAQQHRRPQAEPRPCLDRGRGAGLPHARLRVGVRAHGRRRDGGARRHGRARSRPIPIRATRALGVRRADAARHRASACRSPGQRIFFGDREAARAYDDALARFAQARRHHRRDRHRAVLRDRAAALRGPVARRALSRGALAARVVARRRSIR